MKPFRQAIMLLRVNKMDLIGLVLRWVIWKTSAELNPEYKDISESVSNSLLYT